MPHPIGLSARLQRIVAVACLAGALTVQPLPAQVALDALKGSWIRVGSNYDPNDQMRITIDGAQATLIRVPSTVHSSFKVGQALWVGISPEGSLRVRGSDGTYYPARIRMEGDSLHLEIRQSAQGNDQVWRRAGPSLDGDWVRIAPNDPTSDGIRVRVDQDRGAVRFLPGAAPRTYRIGVAMWRGVSSASGAEVLGRDGRFRPATFRLEGADRVWVESPGRPGELWVRPSEVAAARAGGVASSTVACVATSTPAIAGDRRWWWHVQTLPYQVTAAARIGLEHHAGPTPERTGAIVDLEWASFPDLAPGFSVVYQEPVPNFQTREYRDLTAREFDTQNEEARAQGYRAKDIEIYSTPDGVRYAGVWTTNPEGVEWSVHTELTGDAYGQLFQERRAAGFRLVDVEARFTPAGTRYAAVWHRSCDNDNWRQFRDMSRAAYDRTLDSLSSQAFRVVDFESYRTSAGQRYAAIWERSTGIAWAARSDRTLPAFLNYHRQYADEGFQLVDFESYSTADGVRYAGVWVEQHPRYRLPVRAALDSMVENYRTAVRVPGISVAIIQGGDVIYQRGFGMADSARNIEAHAGTIYLTASIAKAIGGTVAARLEARGEVDLTRTTRSYLSGIDSTHLHTLQQLLSKTGCVVHYPQGPEPQEQSYSSQWGALEDVQDRWILPRCTLGQHYHYSTHGFTLLGAALEAATGKTVMQLVQEEVTTPARLRTVRRQLPYDARSPLASDPRPYHMAEPYVMDTTTRRVAPSTLSRYEDASWKLLGGGLQMDVVDLARFGEWTLNRALSDSVRDNRLWTRLTTGTMAQWDTTNGRVPPAALAWEVRPQGGERVAEHGGTSTGARSYLTIYRDQDLVVAVMSNQREGVGTNAHPVRGLAHNLAALVLNPP